MYILFFSLLLLDSETLHNASKLSPCDYLTSLNHNLPQQPYCKVSPIPSNGGDAIVALWFSALCSLRDPCFVRLYYTYSASLRPPHFGKGTLPWFQPLQRLPTYQPLPEKVDFKHSSALASCLPFSAKAVPSKKVVLGTLH